MKIETQIPFEEYNGYIVVNSQNRRNVCLVHKETKKRTTVSFARYLMCVKEKRILFKEEQVDHIDGDKTNDVIENLQILTIKENNIKKIKETGKSEKMVELKCPNCGVSFYRPVRSSHIGKKGHYSACSKKCSYLVLKLGLSVEELKNLGQNQILKYYRK
jgi:predicted RNA-binding Zn-ribbon protein involved in translation (DUF1610 family)